MANHQRKGSGIGVTLRGIGMELFAGLDIGTNGARIVAADERLDIKHESMRYYPTSSPREGWAQQDAGEIFTACLELLGELAVKFPRDHLQVTFCSVMHSVMGVDGEGNPLTPLIIWADTRSRKKRELLENNHGTEMFYLKTRCPLHSTYWPARILWMKQACAGLDIARFISIKEYVVYRLCGRWLSDYALVSSSGLYNHQQKAYDQEILGIIGITDRNLSGIVPPGERFAFTIHEKAMTGLVGATDGVLANLGTGALNEKKMVVSVGSSAAVRFTTNELFRDPEGRAWCYVLDEGYYVVGEATNGAGIILKWLAELFRYDEVRALLEESFDGVPYPGNELLFIPTLMGEKGPSYNEKIRGMLYGLSLNHSRREIVTAVYEGIALYTRMVYEDVVRAGGRKPEVTLMTGGLGLSGDFMKLARYLLGDVYHLPGHDQNTAVGAVMMGIKETKNIPYEEVLSFLPPEKTPPYARDENFKEYIQRKYGRFLEAYQEISRDYGIYGGKG
jgi:gluconokinase